MGASLVRPEQAYKMRQSGMKVAAIALRMHCSVRTVHTYIERWERHVEAIKRMRMHMRWFGESWHAPVNRECDHAETPVGADCVVCGRVLSVRDQGFLIPRIEGHEAGKPVLDAMHRDCFLHAVGVK